jgi:hypothetical protein
MTVDTGLNDWAWGAVQAANDINMMVNRIILFIFSLFNFIVLYSTNPSEERR